MGSSQARPATMRMRLVKLPALLFFAIIFTQCLHALKYAKNRKWEMRGTKALLLLGIDDVLYGTQPFQPQVNRCITQMTAGFLPRTVEHIESMIQKYEDAGVVMTARRLFYTIRNEIPLSHTDLLYEEMLELCVPADQIQPDPQLRETLLSLNVRLVGLSANSWGHVKTVLTRLGVMDLFEMIIFKDRLVTQTKPSMPHFTWINAFLKDAHTDIYYLDYSPRCAEFGVYHEMRTAVITRDYEFPLCGHEFIPKCAPFLKTIGDMSEITTVWPQLKQTTATETEPTSSPPKCSSRRQNLLFPHDEPDLSAPNLPFTASRRR